MKNKNFSEVQTRRSGIAKRVALAVPIGTCLFANSGFAIGATTSSVTLYNTEAVTPTLTETAPTTTTSLSSQGTGLGGATYVATGTGIAMPGFIRAQSQAAATALNFGIIMAASPNVYVSASWSDVITVNAAGLTGQNGYITGTFQFTGAMAMTASPNNGVGATAGAGSSVGFQVPGFVNGPSSFTAETTDPSFSVQSYPLNNVSYNIGVSFGSATGIAYVVNAFIRADATNAYGTNPDMHSTNLGIASLRWTGISGVFLYDGTPVSTSGVSVTSDSGGDIFWSPQTIQKWVKIDHHINSLISIFFWPCSLCCIKIIAEPYTGVQINRCSDTH